MNKKYFTISEVSNITEIPSHTLRYWESEFKLLRPMRRESGQRRYTQHDIHTIEKIKVLLYEKKYSIAGAKKQLMKEKRQTGSQIEMDLNSAGNITDELKSVKESLLEIKKILSEEI
ncbi:MAG: MerR family transcriptional regulator [Elusimicrobia bacterium]|nr:MerR family transcriptional regulator [Elusimicrobiota bacterium]